MASNQGDLAMTPRLAVDAGEIRRLANSALAGFEDLRIESAVEFAIFNLTEILAHVADDPGSISLIERVESRLRNEGFFGNRNRPDL